MLVAQIDVLRRAARRAQNEGLLDAKAALEKLANAAVKLSEGKLVGESLKVLPSLAAWKTTITKTKLPKPDMPPNATTPITPRLGMIADWLLSLDILATASDMAPVAPDPRPWFSPMLGDFWRARKAEDGPPITEAVEHVVRERHQHYFDTAPRAAQAKALVETTVKRLALELTPSAAARLTAIATVLAALA